MGIQVFRAVYDIDRCLEEIKECLQVGWTGMGYKTEKFENLWKEYTGCENAYFVNSATAALNLAFDILKTENGWDAKTEIISTPLTFVSTNHAIAKAGLHVTFADVDDSFCLDPKDVEKKINNNTKAVCFVAIGGNMGRYEDIVKLCNEHKLALILDAAHMAGTRLRGEVPGKEADVVCWSYQAVKNLPTGDSGMICFKNKEYDKIARQRAWLGINKDTYERTSMEKGSYKWKYDVNYLGNKYNGNSIMAAIAIAQLSKLDEDNEYRRMLARAYHEILGESKVIRFPKVYDNCCSSQHLFQILVDDRDGCLQYLNDREIYPGVHYTVNTEYDMYKYGAGSCPNAEYISEHTLTLPCHLGITKDDVTVIAQHVLDFVDRNN